MMEAQFAEGIQLGEFCGGSVRSPERNKAIEWQTSKQADDSSDSGSDNETSESGSQQPSAADAEQVKKTISKSRKVMGSLEKSITQAMLDINKSSNKPRAESCRIAAQTVQKQLKLAKDKLQQGVTRKKPDVKEMEEIMKESEALLAHSKSMHAEFKPHIRD